MKGTEKHRQPAKASSLEECIKLEYEALKGKLPQDMLQEYEELVFVSKSMGTVLAAHLEEDYGLHNVTHVMLTPIDQTLPYLKTQKKIAYMVTGTADNKVNHEALRKMSREHNYPLTEIVGAGHRLEIKGDVQKSTNSGRYYGSDRKGPQAGSLNGPFGFLFCCGKQGKLS